MQANFDVRETAKISGVKLWQIADRLGIHEVTFIKRLRRELPAPEREKVLTIIDQLSAEREAAQ